jgi:hypothetical protein
MISTFKFPNGDKLEFHIEDDMTVALDNLCDDCSPSLLATIGMLFHYAQQQSGEVYLNNHRIWALSFSQTSGAAALADDYVGVGHLVPGLERVARLRSLILS